MTKTLSGCCFVKRELYTIHPRNQTRSFSAYTIRRELSADTRHACTEHVCVEKLREEEETRPRACRGVQKAKLRFE